MPPQRSLKQGAKEASVLAACKACMVQQEAALQGREAEAHLRAGKA